GRRREDHRFQAGLFQALSEIAGPMGNLEPLRYFCRGSLVPARQGDDFYTRNVGHGLQMLHAESALSSKTDLHVFSLASNYGIFDPQPYHNPPQGVVSRAASRQVAL